jgi:hypothetical protein
MKALESRDYRSWRIPKGNKALFVSVLLLGILGVTIQAQETKDGDGAKVMTLETLWNEAEVHRDIRALDQLLGEKFTFVDIDGSLKNKAEFLDSIQHPPEHLATVVNESMSAQVYDGTVVVNGVYREKGTINGKPYSRRGRFTDTWIRQSSRWLCTASQSTLIQK